MERHRSLRRTVSSMVDLSSDIVARLEAVEPARECPFPSGLRIETQTWLHGVLALLFPHFASVDRSVQDRLEEGIARLGSIVDSVTECHKARTRIGTFWERIPEIKLSLLEDAEAIHFGDPASSGIDEVILTYPGFYAIAAYRIAHELHDLGLPLIPRLVTEIAHSQTGIDLHPAATIGRRFCIDHGTGIVVGATTVIGNGVKLYQGVTLGALTVHRELATTKRHPTIEDNVVIYANATILGGETVIGHDSVIGGNAWITASIPPFSQLSQANQPRSRQDRVLPAGTDLEFNI